MSKLKAFLNSYRNRKILFTGLISRILIVAVGVFIFFTLPQRIHRQGESKWKSPPQMSEVTLKEMWGKWDTNYYIDLVENGYTSLSFEEGSGNKQNWAFSPLYPLLVKLFSGFGLIKTESIIIIIGLVLSNVLFILNLFLFDFVCRKFLSNKQSYYSVVFLSFFPGSLYFSLFYTESLFLTLLLLAYIFILKRKWILASSLVGLLAVTRQVGIVAFLILLIKYLQSVKISFENILKVLVFAFISFLPLILLGIHLKSLTDNFLAGVQIQKEWTNVDPFPFIIFKQVIENFNFGLLVHVVLWLISAAVLFLYKNTISFSLFVFSLVMLFLYASAGTFAMMRMISVVFPLFIQIGKLRKKEFLSEKLMYLNIASLTIWLLLYMTNSSLVV